MSNFGTATLDLREKALKNAAKAASLDAFSNSLYKTNRVLEQAQFI